MLLINMSFYWEKAAIEYAMRHEVFSKRTGQVLRVAEILRRHLPALLNNILQRPPRNSIKILSVGSANGEMDIEILKIVSEEIQRDSYRYLEDNQTPMSIFNRAIEPNKFSLDLYKAALDNLPNELHNTQITFDMDQPKTFQDYMMEVKKTVQFDIVHFIHSLYYIDVEKALTHCYENELGEKGLMISVLAVGEDDIMYYIQQKQLVESQNRLALEKGKDVLKVADKNSWKYQEHIQECYFDVTEIFDEKSVEGNLLLDFLIQTIDFRSNTSQKIVEKYLDLIRKKCVIRDGKYLAKKVQSIVFIEK